MDNPEKQPGLPGTIIRPANQIVLNRHNGAWAATRFGLARDVSIKVKRKYGDGRSRTPDYAVYHLNSLSRENLDKFLVFLEEQGIKYEIL